jgi:3-oxoacyl-[acyl-carrier protein] reductase
MDLGIDGRVAVVTAASRGLGRATAAALVSEGARVLISARDPDRLHQTRDELAAAGGEVVAVPADMTDPSTPGRLVAAAEESLGPVAIAVANAGGPPPGNALDVDDDALEAALTSNLTASIRLVRAAVPGMRARRWGRLCCITSYSVVQPVPGLSLSNTARTGLWAWAKTAAHDLGRERSGVTLNLACPGPHATDRMVQLGGADVMGDPADFGRVVAFLCSEPAGFVNGAAVVVDGGSTLAL